MTRALEEKCRHDDVRGLVRVLRLMPVGALWSFGSWGAVCKTAWGGFDLFRHGHVHRRNGSALATAEALVPSVQRPRPDAHGVEPSNVPTTEPPAEDRLSTAPIPAEPKPGA